MNNKKKQMLIRIICSFVIILFSISNIVFGSITDKIDTGAEGIATDKADHAMEVIIGVFQTAAAGVGAIMLIALAVKYMSAAPGDKAEIKKHAVVYIVGAVMAFAAVGVVEIIKQFADESIK